MSDLLRQLLIEEEGRAASVYEDSEGFLTVGVGHLVDGRKGGKLPEHIIDALLDHDIFEKASQARTLPGFETLNPVRQAVLVSMVFQLGFSGVLGFKKMLGAIAAGDFEGAAAHGLDSRWARQTPKRAQRQMKMLATGQWIER